MNIDNDLFNDNDTEMLDQDVEDEDEEEEEDEEMMEESQQQTQCMDEDMGEDEEDEEDEDEDEDEEDEDEDDEEEEEDEEDEDEEESGAAKKEKDSTTTVEDEYVEKNDVIEEPETQEQTQEAVQEEPNETVSVKQQLYQKARTANGFDIVPYVAITHGTAIHSIALSRGPKWLFTGGEDGFIRKYDFISSIEGNLPLTVAQKHALVDTMSLGGIITSYWENEQPIYKSDLNNAVNQPVRKPGKKPQAQQNQHTLTHYEPKVSPAYSLAVQKDSLWLLSGLESGGITLQTVRHSEGQIKHYFGNAHTATVDALLLNHANDKFLSGSWDKKIFQWDLNTGDIVKNFKDSTSQVSSMSFRPTGGLELVDSNYPTLEKSEEDDEDDMDALFGASNDEDDETNGDGRDVNGGSQAAAGSDTDQMKNEITKQQRGSTNTNGELITDDNIFLSSSMDGSLNIWDVRVQNSNVIRIPVPTTTPPWCMSACWSNCGDYIYAGRRNSTVEEFSIKMPFNKSKKSSVASKTLKFPTVSGPVSVVKPMYNGAHLLCGSYDNVRLYDLRLYDDLKSNPKKAKIPFMIVPGHHGGVLSDIYVDPTCRFMVSASGNRGWNGSSTELGLIYEINIM